MAGAAVFLVAIALGRADAQLALGPVAVTPQEVALALVVLGAAVHTAFVVVGRWGFGPMAAPPADDDPASLLEPPAPAPAGWLRPGAGFGLPLVWIVACLVVLPLGLYVASYLPWAFIEDHQLVTGWPAGHAGQTLVDLTQQMYRYHNNLSAAHAASSPWWAWPFDLKPVWFYQESFAGGTSAAIYDAGNLVAWWLAVPAMAFAAWQAFVRRSAPLALVTIAFACQWIAWSRIDRAAFQYHYYTSLPFLFLALAYFLAELWQGASRRTWLLARLAAGAAVLAPTTLWLLHRPLCAVVRVTDVNPGSWACPTLIPNFVLTGRALAIAVVVGVGVLLLVRLLLSLAAEAERRRQPPEPGARRSAGRLRSRGARGGRRQPRLLRRLGLPRRHAADHAVEHPGRTHRARRDPGAHPDRGVRRDGPRRPAVRAGGRRRDRGLVRHLVPEHRRAPAADGVLEHVPGPAADPCLRVPVPGEHGRPECRGTVAVRRRARRCCS